MDSQLQKAVEIIPKTRVILQEFLALLADKKPVVLVGLRQNEYKLIKTNFPELYYGFPKDCFNQKLTLVTISKSKLLTNITSTLVDTNPIDSNKYYVMIGSLLGYPKCCIDNYLKYTDDTDEEKRYNASVITNDSYKSSKELNYYCNNFLNFSTRINKNRVDNFSKFRLLNKNLSYYIEYYQYISHIPCRYDCQNSIKIGKDVEVLLIKYAPNLQNTIQSTLSKPILYFDLFKLVIFDGFIKNDILFYQKVIPPYFLIDSKLLKAIHEGNRIKTSPRKVYIFKDDTQIYEYSKRNERDGYILDFCIKNNN